MSFFSAACQTCKSRHLKCDEGRPVCQRCVKSRRQCHRVDAVIHNENVFASRKKKRPPGPRAGPVVRALPTQSLVVTTPSVDVNLVAFTYYLQKHLRATEDLPSIMTSQSDDVVQLWTPKIDNPLLELSISTMALAIFSRVHKHPEAAVAAGTQYQKLLRSARMNMTSIDTTSIDTVMLAIFFMGRYEDSMHLPELGEERQNFASALRSVPHHEGAVAMLKIWKDHWSTEQPPSSVIRHSRQGMIRSAMMRNRPIPDWMSDGILFGERGLELEYDRIMVRLVNVRYCFSLLQDTVTSETHRSDAEAAVVDKLVEETREIDDAIQAWAKHFPIAWRPQRHHVERQQSKHIRGSYVYSYGNPAFAAVWNRCYAATMLVNSSQIDMLHMSKAGVDLWMDVDCIRCLSRIESASDELSASIPFMLGRFIVPDKGNTSNISDQVTVQDKRDPEPYVAGMTAWPLTIASSLKYLDHDRRQWFRTELGEIGGLLGNKVFEAVKSDHWLEL